MLSLITKGGGAHSKRQRQGLSKNLIGPIWRWAFSFLTSSFQWNYAMLYFLADFEFFFHLNMDCYEGFNLTTFSFNRSLLFTFQTSQFDFIILCFLLHCSFWFWSWCPTSLLTMVFPLQVVSSPSPLMVASQLPSTFCGICDPTTSTFASWNNQKFLKFVFVNEGCLIQIVVDFVISKENFGSIVGFGNHCHLARNMSLMRNN